jgi:hypothetical protein
LFSDIDAALGNEDAALGNEPDRNAPSVGRYGIAKDQARKEVDDRFRAQTW